MGIDVYLRWKLITEDEVAKQYSGFSVKSGHLGYLREAYHGEPYATRRLLPEGFEAHGEPVHIPPEVLRERLPGVIKDAMERERALYGNDTVDEESPVIRSFTDFVELYEKMAAQGKHPMVHVSY